MPAVEDIHPPKTLCIRLLRANRHIVYVLVLLLFLTATPVFAQHYIAYAWTDANLALIYPEGWDAPVAAGDNSQWTLTLSDGDTTITLTVLPISTQDASLRPTLEAQLAQVNLLPLQYTVDPFYGRSGLRIDAVSADRQQIGMAQSGRLPDSRALLIVARAPEAARISFDDDLNAILNSLVFSARVLPVMPTYHPLWTSAPVGSALGLAVANDRLYMLDVAAGVRVIDTQTQNLIALYSYDHPAQPTSIAVDGAGIVYIGDTVCRCVRRMTPDGAWLDPVGSFGGGAPYSLAVAQDGTIYATDKTDSGYVLRILGEPRNRTVGLNFNDIAPPRVTVNSSGQVWVIEWLASLIDGSISAAVSRVSGDKPSAELQFWLQSRTPQTVTALASSADGDLILATTDQGVIFINANGEIVNQVADDLPSVAAASPDGTLYIAHSFGNQEAEIRAYTTHGAADHFGNSALELGVPVQGIMAQDAPEQLWTYSGTAGEKVTISAVDLSRIDPYATGLDVALHLLAPDGSELASNDDQLGADLFGVYDAQIPDFTLPQTGIYRLAVEWRQGAGTYTLGISGDQVVELSEDGVTSIEGRLQDVFPVQHWTFAGHAGDALTITMSAESGTLDPALELLKPDGSLLAFNDDAHDPELNINAQLTQVRLPEDGTYVLRASRYEGAGRYTLVIVRTD